MSNQFPVHTHQSMLQVLDYMSEMKVSQTTGQISTGVQRKAMTVINWLEKLEAIGCIKTVKNLSHDARVKHSKCWVVTGLPMAPFVRSKHTTHVPLGNVIPECKRIIGPARQMGMVRADPLMVALYGAA